MTQSEMVRLADELRRFQDTVDELVVRAQHSLLALALTYDAQAATMQHFDGHGRARDLHDAVADLQTAAEQYRHLARSLPHVSRNPHGPIRP